MADGFKPTLAVVFISIKQDRKAVCEILNNYGIDIIGATSCGEFINGSQTKGEIAVMLLEVSTESFAIHFENIGQRSIQEVSREIAKNAHAKFTNPALIICSTGVNRNGEFFHGEALVRNLEEALGSQRLFFGGMAGDDMTLTGSYVFTKG
ncbi:MAG: FIST N-terminal domain-containing protein [Melioribacteraceae bacterium]|nr:FIST N-terminal domain-containing protein [Melioribacteraceae bacterium]